MVKEYHIVSLDFDGVLAHGVEVKIRYAKKWFGLDLALHETKKDGFEAKVKQLGMDISYRDLMDPLNEARRVLLVPSNIPTSPEPVIPRPTSAQ